jgi:hypothetical protein
MRLYISYSIPVSTNGCSLAILYQCVSMPPNLYVSPDYFSLFLSLVCPKYLLLTSKSYHGLSMTLLVYIVFGMSVTCYVPHACTVLRLSTRKRVDYTTIDCIYSSDLYFRRKALVLSLSRKFYSSHNLLRMANNYF